MEENKNLTRRTLTELKNDIVVKLLSDNELVRSLVVTNEDFLNTNLTLDDNIQNYINNPMSLIRDRVFPYKKNLTIETEGKIILSMEFSNFRPSSYKFRNGVITIYILCPFKFEKTKYGIRYDWIADRLEKLFCDGSGIGHFEFKERGDITINDTFLGHYVSFNILDFFMS